VLHGQLLAMDMYELGLALDYIPGKVNLNYGSNEDHGQERIKETNLQLKLNFTL
jgi:hypothetical protein